MPGRPPRRWMRAAVDAIAASGSADNPRAVAGAMWQRKTPAQRRALIASEERTMAKKKKKKKPAHKRKAPKRSKKRHPKKKKAGKRCGSCGHTAKHGRAGCLHHAGLSFCPCKARG